MSTAKKEKNDMTPIENVAVMGGNKNRSRLKGINVAAKMNITNEIANI